MSNYTELIKALRCYSACRKGEIAELTADAAAAIEKLQAEVNGLIADAGARIGKAEAERPHWVSVEERLPEKECDLLFVVHTPAYHDIGFDEDMPPETKCVYGSFYPENHRGHRWWSWKEPFDGGYEAVIRNEYSEEPEFGSKTYITHWMPLPEPPQEVQE